MPKYEEINYEQVEEIEELNEELPEFVDTTILGNKETEKETSDHLEKC